MQERTYTFAMKSSIPLVDPRYDMERMVDLTEQCFGISEASNMPVFLNMRIRACHLTGTFTAKDNKVAHFNSNNPIPEQKYDVTKIVLPPASYQHEIAKFEARLPAAENYAKENKINEFFDGSQENKKIGIITQGGTYTVVMRALRRLGAADAYGNSDVEIYCMNLVYPLIKSELIDFMANKDSVLVVEEGNPNYIETQIAEIAHTNQIKCRVHGKGMLPMAGEYVSNVVREGIAQYLAEEGPTEIS
jgi:indolepyruvate ferredoxin oxidoreductase alpha subunit